MADDAPGERLLELSDVITPMAIRVAATLRLADRIAEGRTTAAELAEATRTHPDALGRLLRHLVTAGLLVERPDGGFALTEVGERLRDGAGLRAWLDVDSAVGRADLSFVRLLDVVRTGRPAYPAMYGRGFWDDLAVDRGLAGSFDALMAGQIRAEAAAILAGYDWGGVGHVVDVGGGNGALLVALATAHPSLRGTLVDLPGPAEAAARAFAEAGVADRCRVAPGSFFDALPVGGDVYVLSSIIHDWDDERSVAILRRCAEAAGPGRRVLLVEGLVDAGGDQLPRTAMDLRMLTFIGGRERSAPQLAELGAAAGLTLCSVHTISPYRSLLEFTVD
ncbi:O-methyltransferase [Streptoalloteichus tenebrarius]|uniref:O-methyltransferase n=1 Tax=Streptoalloteichus tenebrarius (strain ATCC 17920 / DSM 40477 / JCM 4838 / CBS 697.72 / NBRC 16177 / NCIMB 11028 / NRRL B-12390 / A12253. 1 / ISP 5477) TaxID=1933 RepID=A0ABT1HP55_STRSD|nr:methyltransferase [Streptoalloteichus tenebrarius]MCP2257301.1 O-methyltransferase [Streptoalloteichus tenebrarius]BFF04211.1 methyltransferase [Streptoalloteichus tenebrarius]